MTRPFYHPQCRPDEIYLGDFTREEFALLPRKTKRRGHQNFALARGRSARRRGLFPVFIRRSEFGEGCRIWTARHKHER